MIRRIDDFLIDHVFQPIAWKIERRWNKDNFYLARNFFNIVIVATVSLIGLKVALNLQRGNWLGIAGYTFLAILSLGVGILLVFHCYRVEQSVRRNPQLGNPERANEFIVAIRVLWVVLAISDCIELFITVIGYAPPAKGDWRMSILGWANGIGFPLAMYFLACSPAPTSF